MDATYTAALDAIIDANAEHAPSCAGMSFWTPAACFGKWTGKGHVAGHIKALGFTRTADAINACHAHEDRLDALYAAAYAVRGTDKGSMMLDLWARRLQLANAS